MKNIDFVMRDKELHILDYPMADRVVELPNDNIMKQFKDMQLHIKDLEIAKESIEEIKTESSDIVNIALITNAIIRFYKCFGTSEFRNNKLDIKKILKKKAEEKDRESAKAVFDYYENLRNKYIAHDESRYDQVLVGGVLETKKDAPFVDVVCLVVGSDVFLDESHIKGVKSLYRLICISLSWAREKVDELVEMIKEKYNDFSGDDFYSFDELKLAIPNNDNMFEKRY